MKNNGNIIAELRREAGYTQKTLAEAINITDKAVSKWERGLSLPDVSLLPKLSALLDADIELLLKEDSSSANAEWSGLIDLRDCKHDLAQTLYDKPMVYYILAHFLLLDIRKIHIWGDTQNQSWLKWDTLQALGFHFDINPKEHPKENLMIMNRPCFLFGTDLTRRFQAAMSMDKVIKLCPAWDMTPFLFCPAEYTFMYFKNCSYLYKTATLKTLGRGVICLPLETPEQLNDVSSFVRMYQHNTGLNIHDLLEIHQSATQ